MMTPEKIADIKTQAVLQGIDPHGAVEEYKMLLENEQKAQKEANLEIWKKLGSAGTAEDFTDHPS